MDSVLNIAPVPEVHSTIHLIVRLIVLTHLRLLHRNKKKTTRDEFKHVARTVLPKGFSQNLYQG